jgi:uncharacterized protein (TIGR02217 family)
MTITVLSDVVLLNGPIQASVKGRNTRKNQRVSSASGQEWINIGPQDKTIREFDIELGPVRRALWIQLESLHEVTEAGAYGFLLQDPKDCTVSGTAGIVAAQTGGGYQAFKRYTEPTSGRHKDRKITRIRAAGLQVFVNGVSTSFTVDANTGTFTSITGNPAANTVTWTGVFYVPVHFLNDTIDWQMDVAGTDPEGRFIAGPSVTLREILE